MLHPSVEHFLSALVAERFWKLGELEFRVRPGLEFCSLSFKILELVPYAVDEGEWLQTCSALSVMLVTCPHCYLQNSSSGERPLIVRLGFFRRKSDQARLQRFFCRPCQKSSSEACKSLHNLFLIDHPAR